MGPGQSILEYVCADSCGNLCNEPEVVEAGENRFVAAQTALQD